MLECLPPPPPESVTFSSQLHLRPSPLQAAPEWPPMDDSSPGSASTSTSTSTSTVNLSHAHAHAHAKVLHSDSYKEMSRISSIIDHLMIADQDHKNLSPDRDHIHNVLRLHRCKSNTLSNFISSYFLHSEETSRLCLTLRTSVIAACRLYYPIQTLVAHDLPIHSLSESDCSLAFQQLLNFTNEPNPFPHPDSKTFDAIGDLFCDLKQKLDRRLRKSSSRIRFVAPATTVCCGGGGAAVTRREVTYTRIASRKTYYLKTGLDSLHRIVVRLHNAVEHDKDFINACLKTGDNNKTVRKVLQELRQNYQSLAPALVRLEEEREKYFTIVNESRKELLREILRHQTSSDSSHYS